MHGAIRAGTIRNTDMYSIQQLKEMLEYDPDTGIFTWRVGHRKGFTAGSKTDYIRIVIIRDYVRVEYMAHRLAWLFTYARWPALGLEIDHINRIKTDNRIVNLREVTHQVNMMNKKNRHFYRFTGGLDDCR